MGLQKTDKKESLRRLQSAPKQGGQVSPPKLAGTLSVQFQRHRGRSALLLRLRRLSIGRGLLLHRSSCLPFHRLQRLRRLPLQRGLAVGVLPASCSGVGNGELIVPSRAVGRQLFIVLKWRNGLGELLCRVQSCPESEVCLHESGV